MVVDEVPNGYWPIEWNFGENPCDGRNGPPIDDPDIYRVEFESEDDHFRASLHADVSLMESIDNIIFGMTCGGVVADAHRKSMEAIRDHLRKMADKLDAALKVRS
jgi:hypothetical protein